MEGYCDLCGRRFASDKHHLIFGYSLRSLSDADRLAINLCSRCHNMGSATEKIHGNSAAESLSKMLGQALYERNQLGSPEEREAAREKFMQRYGRSYL